MPQTIRQADLFVTPQPDLFGPPAGNAPDHGPARMVPLAREHLGDMLARVRRMQSAAPGSRTEAMVFHNMADWLPEPERAAVRAAFRAEWLRLGVTPYAGDG